MADFAQSEAGHFEHPAVVYQAVVAGEVTVTTEDSVVQVRHPLWGKQHHES